MKIYTKVVINMETLKVDETECFEYTGPVAQCGKGGGGGGSASPDYEYNRTLGKIQEANQGMAVEMFNLFKHGVTYDPTEVKYLDENGNVVAMTPGEMRNTTQNAAGEWVHPDLGTLTRSSAGEQAGFNPDEHFSEMELMQEMLSSQGRLIKVEEDLKRTQMETETGLVPLRGELETEQIGMARRLLPGQEKLAETQLREGEILTRERSGLMQSLYKDALAGVDVEGRVSEHRAGVEHAFKNQQEIMNRNLSRMGIDPSSGRGLAAAEGIGLEKAKATALGETQIRRGAETEDFQRQQVAAGLPI
ncbi:MAG: hypothetical protein ACYTE8_00410 [Planctomycetota bacterium]|jgi:hypothetical protein